MHHARQLFDVIYWGMVAMTKAFTEMLIAAQGAVVNIGSISGGLNTPFSSMQRNPHPHTQHIYHASIVR